MATSPRRARSTSASAPNSNLHCFVNRADLNPPYFPVRCPAYAPFNPRAFPVRRHRGVLPGAGRNPRPRICRGARRPRPAKRRRGRGAPRARPRRVPQSPRDRAHAKTLRRRLRATRLCPSPRSRAPRDHRRSAAHARDAAESRRLIRHRVLGRQPAVAARRRLYHSSSLHRADSSHRRRPSARRRSARSAPSTHPAWRRDPPRRRGAYAESPLGHLRRARPHSGALSFRKKISPASTTGSAKASTRMPMASSPNAVPSTRTPPSSRCATSRFSLTAPRCLSPCEKSPRHAHARRARR